MSRSDRSDRSSRSDRSTVLCVVLLAALAIEAASHAQAPAVPLPMRQIAYLKASHPPASGQLGCGGEKYGHNGQSVALSADGRPLAVGAPPDSSAARDVNGNQRDNSVFAAGAGYVFSRTGDA